MIKRSNRGKLSGSLGGRGSTRHDGGSTLRRSFRMVAISALTAVAVALFAAVPAFAADISLGAPGHSKTAILDPKTGKINITLSVTGNTDTSESKSSANLIVVLDKSGSMNEGVDKVSNPDKSKTYYAQVKNYNWREVSYGYNYWDDGYGWYDSYGNEYDESELFSSKTTRLDVAKSALCGLADQLIKDENSTVKISLETFSGYANNPSAYYRKGQADAFKNLVNSQRADGGTNWTDALAKANYKATTEESSTPTYIVFLSDGKPTFSMDGDNNRYGTGSESQPESKINQFVTDAVNTANARPKNVLGFYAIYTGSDAATSMNNFASKLNPPANNTAIDGSNSKALQDAFKDIVKTINKGISYTNVEITDTNSDYVDYVLPDGKTPEFTYQKNGVAWAETETDAPPKATFANGQVSWNLGNRKLEKNVTYSVSFDVTLNQHAYDEAALGKLKDNQVPTNSAAQLAYSTVITTNGHDEKTEQKPIDIPSPVVSVPVSSISVTKVWDPENAALTSATVKLQWKNADGDWEDVKDSKGNSRTLVLNGDGDNKWTGVFNNIAAGPVGHEYQVVETDPSDANAWTTSYAYSLKENSYYDNETNKSKVNENDGIDVSITLAGRKAQAASATVTNKQNTHKLTITKSVTGNFGDTSKYFSFKLTDASGKAITNVKPVSTDVSLESDGCSFKLKNGQKLVVELPYGASYKVVEYDPKEGTNDTVDYTTTIDAGDSGATTVAKERTASSPKDGITKDTTITYTNERKVNPDVGVDLGSGAPYAAVFGGVGIAGVIWMVLKRRNSLGI